MTRDARIIAGIFLFNFIYGLSNYLGQVNTFVPPILTDHLLLFAVSVYFLIKSRSEKFTFFIILSQVFVITIRTLDGHATQGLIGQILELPDVAAKLVSIHSELQILLKLSLGLFALGYLLFCIYQFQRIKTWIRYLPILPLLIVLTTFGLKLDLSIEWSILLTAIVVLVFGVYITRINENLSHAVKRYLLILILGGIMMLMNLLFYFTA